MAESPAFRTAMQFVYGEPAEMAPGVQRIVAENPSPLTFKGTNTYLVGSERLAVIDPGPDDPRHHAAILAAAGGRPITQIVLTHRHPDHLDGLAALQAATGATTYAFAASVPAPIAQTSEAPLPGANASGQTIAVERARFAFTPDVALADGDVVEIETAGAGLRLTAVHTPGHTPDHLCLALSGATQALLSGDHVMSWNTTVVIPPEGRMADYLASLRLLLERDDALYLPGHGGRLAEPRRLVKSFLIHRRAREQAILDAIRRGERTIQTLVSAVYPGLDARLLKAAAFSTEAHVEHLIEQGLVRRSGPVTSEADLWAV